MVSGYKVLPEDIISNVYGFAYPDLAPIVAAQTSSFAREKASLVKSARDACARLLEEKGKNTVLLGLGR